MNSLAKIVPLEHLLALRPLWKQAGKTMVFTNGCFDLLHIGHVRGLQEAQALGDLLVVALNDDASVRQIKGAPRPIVPQAERAEVLAALACVDYVVLFADRTPETLVAALQPEVYAKGGDYLENELPEAKIVARYQGKVHLLNCAAGHSTTSLIEKIVERYGEKPA